MSRDNKETDYLSPPRRTPPALRIAAWAVGVAAIAFVVVTLQRLKHDRESFTPRQPSIESVRLQIQRTTDPAAASVSRTPILTTFAQIRAETRPAGLDHDRHTFSASRIAPFETRIWTFQARILEIQLRQDHDYYLVIEADGLRGCVELPNPALCKSSPFIDQIKRLRATLDKEWKPSRQPVKVDRLALLTGVGFFGTAGKSENGARLMPLLDLKWVD